MVSSGMSTTATREACTRQWCSLLPQLAPADLAAKLGSVFGEAALACGADQLARAWARAFCVDSVVGRSTALGRLASAARELGRPELARELLAEAFACAAHEWHRVDLILDADLADASVAALVRDQMTPRADRPRGVVELAWYLARAQLPADEEDAQLAIVTDVVAEQPPADQRRCAVDAALWLVHARRGDRATAAEARARVVDAIAAGLDFMPPGHSRAVIAAVMAAGELPALARELPWMLIHDVVAAQVHAGDLTTALMMPYPPPWLPARLARARPDDPRAPAWIASAEAHGATLAEEHAEGLITSFEFLHARLELAAMRGRLQDPRGRAGLVDVLAEVADPLVACLHATRTLVTEMGDGQEFTREPDPKWSTPKGERKLARALEQWCSAPDWRTRYQRGYHGAQIFAAATTFALSGDEPRALALMQRAFVDNQHMVALVERVQPTLVTAWLATDQIEQALGLAWATPLAAPALAPLLVELVEFDETARALDLLGPALARAYSAADLHALAPAILAVADDRHACAQEMLAALSAAETAIGTITACAPGTRETLPP